MKDVTIIYGGPNKRVASELQSAIEFFGIEVEVKSISEMFDPKKINPHSKEKVKIKATRRDSSPVWLVIWDDKIYRNGIAIGQLSAAFESPKLVSFFGLKSEPILCTVNEPRMTLPPTFTRGRVHDISRWYIPDNITAAKKHLKLIMEAVDLALGTNNLLVDFYDATTKDNSEDRVQSLLKLQSEVGPPKDIENKPVSDRLKLRLLALSRKYVETPDPMVFDEEAKKVFDSLTKIARDGAKLTAIDKLNLPPSVHGNAEDNVIALQSAINSLASDPNSVPPPPLGAIVFDPNYHTSKSGLGKLLTDYVALIEPEFRKARNQEIVGSNAEALDSLLKRYLKADGLMLEACRTWESEQYPLLRSRLFEAHATASLTDTEIPWLYESSAARRKEVNRSRKLSQYKERVVAWLKAFPAKVTDNLAVSLATLMILSSGTYFGAQYFGSSEPTKVQEEIEDRSSLEPPPQLPAIPMSPIGANAAFKFEGQSGKFSKIKLSDDGNNLVAISTEGNLKVWDLSTFSESGELFYEPSKFSDVEFIGTGANTVITSSFDGSLQVWDVQSNEVISDRYNRYTESEILSFRRANQGQYKVQSFALASDPDRLIVGGFDNAMHIVNISTSTDKSPRLQWTSQVPVTSEIIDLDERNGTVAACDTSGVIYRSAFGLKEDSEDIVTPGLGSAKCTFVTFSGPEGTLLIGQSNGELILWDTRTAWDPQIIEVGKKKLDDAKLSDDGEWLVTVGPGDAKGGRISVYGRTDDGFELLFERAAFDRVGGAHQRRTSPGEPLCCELYSVEIIPGIGPGGTPQFLTAGDDGRVVLWNMEMAPIDGFKETLSEISIDERE